MTLGSQPRKAEAPRQSVAPSGPLTGIRVIDCSTVFAAPQLTAYLADFGAEVIKIEQPSGDPVRGFEPTVDGRSLWWKLVNRNKLSVTLDLHAESGRSVLRQLVQSSDVFVANFRPGVLERWNLGYDSLSAGNSGLVMTCVTAFGYDGPYRDRRGFGTLAEAMSGLANLTGYADGPPLLPTFGLGDAVAALAGALATSLALYHRSTSGQGQFIDATIVEPLISLLGIQTVVQGVTGEVMRREGNRMVQISPRGAWRTGDGRWVAISIGNERSFLCLVDALGAPHLLDDARFVTNELRVKNNEALEEILTLWFGGLSYSEAILALETAGAPFAPVYDAAQLREDPQYRARGVFVDVEDDELGKVTIPNVIARMSRTPGSMRFAGRQKGIDNHYVFGELLGLNEIEIHDLETQHAI